MFMVGVSTGGAGSARGFARFVAVRRIGLAEVSLSGALEATVRA